MLSLLMPFVASGVLISSPFQPLDTQLAPKTSPYFTVNLAMPDKNITPYKVTKEDAPKPTIKPYTPKPNLPQAETIKSQAPTNEPQPTRSMPQSSYEEVYKAAGAQYGIPWEILYGLHYTETGLRDGEIYNGQGSGAQGPMQFMPGTWRAYGVDGDGDGYANINQAVDAIYGAANYLAKHGSLDNALRAYGCNIPGVLNAARSKGYEG